MKVTPIDQRKYTYLYLGDGKTTVAQAGCFSCCLAMITGKSIEDTLAALKSGGSFNGAYLKHPKDALALGFETYEATTIDPKSLCIAEVDFNPVPDKDQHFVVWLGDGTIVDPWGGVQKKNPYKVYTYRIYKPLKEDAMNKDFVQEVALSCGKNKDFFGDNINEKEQEDAAKRLKEYREELEADVKEAENTATAQNSFILELQKKVKQLESAKPADPTAINNYTLAQLAGAFFRKITPTVVFLRSKIPLGREKEQK